jgi:membrane-bound ClpP family serine protease
MENLWPIFLLGVAIGLLQAYLFGGREKYLLIPVGILGAISLFFLINNLVFIDFRLLAGILLVLIGIWIIFKKIKSNNGT